VPDERSQVLWRCPREHRRERVRLLWATTQINLANSLKSLGKHESGTDRLNQAVVFYRDPLAVATRELQPIHWAEGYGNQGAALMHLAKRTNDAGLANSAITKIEAALKTMIACGHEWFAAHYDALLTEAYRFRNAL
jgi:hypothetical protein